MKKVLFLGLCICSTLVSMNNIERERNPKKREVHLLERQMLVDRAASIDLRDSRFSTESHATMLLYECLDDDDRSACQLYKKEFDPSPEMIKLMDRVPKNRARLEKLYRELDQPRQGYSDWIHKHPALAKATILKKNNMPGSLGGPEQLD